MLWRYTAYYRHDEAVCTNDHRFSRQSPPLLELHLQPLERVDRSLRADSLPLFARKFARRSFDKLARNIQTAVSVAVYDGDGVQNFVQSVQSTYDSTLISLTKFTCLDPCNGTLRLRRFAGVPASKYKRWRGDILPAGALWTI